MSPRRSALAKTVEDSATDSADEITEVTASVSRDRTPGPVVVQVRDLVVKYFFENNSIFVQHVTKSPPHITDHCYASMEADHCYARQPATILSEDTDSEPEIVEVGGGGGGGDHDYTTPRTPPKAAPVTALAVRQKTKKLAAARPALPVKPVKWKQREYAEKFQIIYKFLTNGVDAEDIMYLKKSYEMVNILRILLNLASHCHSSLF